MKSIITVKKATPFNTLKSIFADHLEERRIKARLTKTLNLLTKANELLDDGWHDDAQDDIQCAIYCLIDDMGAIRNALD